MKKTTEKARKEAGKGDFPPQLTRSVLPFVSYGIMMLPLKHRYSLSMPVTLLLLLLSYYGAAGSSMSQLTLLVNGYKTGSAYRNVQYRVDTLMGKGLIERIGSRYRVSAMGVEALSRVTVEGEGAKILLDIERKMERDEKRRAKKLTGDLSK